jgi:hypothetical protein
MYHLSQLADAQSLIHSQQQLLLRNSKPSAGYSDHTSNDSIAADDSLASESVERVYLTYQQRSNEAHTAIVQVSI